MTSFQSPAGLASLDGDGDPLAAPSVTNLCKVLDITVASVAMSNLTPLFVSIILNDSVLIWLIFLRSSSMISA